MSIASFCCPEACGVTPSATLAPCQRWLLCPAGHTHCLALSSYTTAKQTADHTQRFKKDEEVVQRWPLKSNFLILVTSLVPLGPSFPSLSIHEFMLQPLKRKCWHLMWNHAVTWERELIKPCICLHNQPQVGALSSFSALRSPHVNLPLACICSEPWLSKQISAHQHASGHLHWPAMVSKESVCFCFKDVAQF